MPKKRKEIFLKGVIAAPGVVQGRAFVLLEKDLDVSRYRVDPKEADKESERFREALSQTRQQIENRKAALISKLGEQEAQIFDAHLLVLEDQALIDETIEKQRKSGYNIEYCFHTVSNRYIEMLDQIEDEYLRERATDIRDVARRVLSYLMGNSGFSLEHFKDERVLVAKNLSPSDTAVIDKKRILAIVTDLGSRTSHAVIVARKISIPAVVGLHNITEKVDNGDPILVDGYTGVVIVHPSRATLDRYGKISAARESLQNVYDESLPLPAKSLDGRSFDLMANIEGREDIEAVRHTGAQGVGLFRTEALFLNRQHYPSEAEQFDVYREVAAALQPQPVIIRTLDLGGDKYANERGLISREDNPFMGLRGIRFCLKYKMLFKTQLRAILRASAFGHVGILYPMISGLDELLEANALLDEVKEELRQEKQAFSEEAAVGVMIEIPSAACIADILADHCTFFSIGTNDLIQYLMAVDRINDEVAQLYNPHHPAVLRTIKAVVDIAKQRGMPVNVCGEMAGDVFYLPLLFGLGTDSLSAVPRSLAQMKYWVRKMTMGNVVALAEQALEQKDAETVYALLKAYYYRQIGDLIEPNAALI